MASHRDEADQSGTSQTTEPVDLTSNPHSLHRAVYARRAEYTRSRRISVKIGTWNVAASPGTDKDVAGWFIGGHGIEKDLMGLRLSDDTNNALHQSTDGNNVRVSGQEEIDLYVLGLQEVMSLNPVAQYISADSNTIAKWKKAVDGAMPKGYQCVAEEQMSGLVLLIFASPKLASTIGNVSTRSIGTGVGGWLGNKGAAVARIELSETTRIVFVNSHLSSGNEYAAVERRLWDARTIVERTRFDPARRGDDVLEDEAHIGDEDFAFWFGDLNFRLEGIPGEDTRRLLTLHTTGEYKADAAKQAALQEAAHKPGDDEETLPDPDHFEPEPAEDPLSLQATLNSLLTHDQLLRVMKEHTGFQEGWREGQISFLPSYKYDTGEVARFDTSEKQRAPSWCDRILYRTRQEYLAHRKRSKDQEAAKKRDAEMKARGMEHAADDDAVLFSYDPESDGTAMTPEPSGLEYDEAADDGEDAAENTRQRIQQQLYTSHQRVTTSDHKPVVSVFTIEYDAVVPELKAQVHAEVAKELDRAENEGRPIVTVVVDKSHLNDETAHDDGSIDFGSLAVLQTKSVNLTVANTGQVDATISFVGTPGASDADQETSIPAWLTALLDEDSDEPKQSRQQMTLAPGDTVTATLSVCVDDVVHMRTLNSRLSKLDAVLVLRVADGRDHFIPISATWLPTCIGRSIEELNRVPDGGIRDFVSLLSKQRQRQVGSISYDLDVHTSAPRELFKLIEYVETLIERVLGDETMLEEAQIPRDLAGWPFETTQAVNQSVMRQIVEQMDGDKAIAKAFDPALPALRRLETVAAVLTLFLRGLTDGVISVPLWSRLEHAPITSIIGHSHTAAMMPVEDEKEAVLDILSTSPHHNICFVFLTTALTKLIAELAPISEAEQELLKTIDTPSSPNAVAKILASRPLGFRRNTASSSTSSASVSAAEAVAAQTRRTAKAKRYAEILAPVMFRAARPMSGIFHANHRLLEKERKAVDEKQQRVLLLFLLSIR